MTTKQSKLLEKSQRKFQGIIYQNLTKNIKTAYKVIDGQRKEIKQTTKTDLSYKLNKKPINLGNSLLKNKDYNKMF